MCQASPSYITENDQEFDVEATPLDRGHQDRITMLKQEIKVILDTLSEQERVVSKLQCSSSSSNRRSRSRYAEEVYDYMDELSPAPKDSKGIQDLLVKDSRLLLEKRISSFREIDVRASDLESWVSLHFNVPSGIINYRGLLRSMAKVYGNILTAIEHISYQFQPGQTRFSNLRIHNRDHHIPPAKYGGWNSRHEYL